MEKCKPCHEDLNGGCWFNQRSRHIENTTIPRIEDGAEDSEIALKELEHLAYEDIDNYYTFAKEVMDCPQIAYPAFVNQTLEEQSYEASSDDEKAYVLNQE